MGNGQQAAPWEHETLGRAATFARLELLGLADDDMIVISDADEVMSRRTARVLAEVLGCDRTTLYVQHERTVIGTELDAYRELIRRRGDREPVSGILGRREFRSLDFKVTDDVLTPRPETEHLVDEAVAAARVWHDEHPDEPLLTADLGTGSGCVAVALAVELPETVVHAVEASPAALEVARGNVATHVTDGRVVLHAGDPEDWTGALTAAGLTGHRRLN